MPPNATKPLLLPDDSTTFQAVQSTCTTTFSTTTTSKKDQPPQEPQPQAEQQTLLDLLDAQADTSGLQQEVDDKEDWTDVKHSERKKRDRILDDGVLLGLMKKSNAKGLERLVTNLSIMALTVWAIDRVTLHAMNPWTPSTTTTTTSTDSSLADDWTWTRVAAFVALYMFYGFQFQCFAFAGQHEFLHRNAFASKWINDVCLFLVGCFCFELGEHERVMHKQHHTYTNNIDKDPELTSFFSREQLESVGFRNVPFSRWAYYRQFWDVVSTFYCRAGRIVNSARGIAVDYSGTGWSLPDFHYGKDSRIMLKLQRTARAQLAWYATCALVAATVDQGGYYLLFWWLVPVLVGYPVVNYFRNLEHADCDVSKTPNCLLNTRSVRSNLLVRLLLWDTNYHAEHHCYPMVPFYNLHKINQLMYEHCQHNEQDHFTTQNWAAVAPGGWIDQQDARIRAAKQEAAATGPRPKSE